MNGKSTPGPWKTRPSSTFNADIVEPVKDLGMICIISARENQEDEKANAALIAAVPELLEALGDLLGTSDISGNTCRWCGRKYGKGHIPIRCESDDCPGYKARAAIKKATWE